MNTTIDRLVNKFLGWKLPKDFSPDGGIVFDKHQNHHITPTGTNLFSAEQAKAMFEHLLADEPQPILSQGEPVAWRFIGINEHEGMFMLKDRMPKKYDKTWWKVENLYLAPPSTEALQKDKAELIAYAKMLVERLCLIDKGLESNFASQMEAATALSIPQPKCLKGQMHGIVIDAYKLGTFKRLLEQGGYKFETIRNQNNQTYVLTVETDNTEALAEVVKQANSMSKI